MRHVLISPRIAIQKGDFLGSGVPYWPVELATLAAFLRERQDAVSVCDLFGSDPRALEERSDHYLQGKPVQSVLAADLLHSADCFIVYALSYMSHAEILHIIRYIRSQRPSVPIAVLENSQAVTAYAIPHVAAQFFEAGASALLCGEPYWNWMEVESVLRGGSAVPPNVLVPSSPVPFKVFRKTEKVPSFPIPAWDLFQLENYWKLPYSHGPKTRRFLPIITARGCPYPCDFCVVPETNQKLWRGRSAKEVADEMIALRDRFGVRDFQLEDLNPTVKSSRMDELAHILIERKADIRFYIVSGTKAETLRLESIPLLSRAGLRYVSISPESGSERVMKVIGKPFDYDHGRAVVEACRKHGIFTQACFIVGHPSEEHSDFELSAQYLRSLVRAGLDEVAVFVVAPFAGSRLFQQNKISIGADALVSFSPKGRANYAELESRRGTLIRIFFVEKLKKGLDLWMQGVRAILGRPATKMENLPRRIVFLYWLLLRHRLRAIFGKPSSDAPVKKPERELYVRP